MISPSTTLSSLGLSKRTLAALESAALTTIGDIMQLPEIEIRTKMPTVAALDVLEIVRHYNLTLPTAAAHETPEPSAIVQMPEAVPALLEAPTSALVIGGVAEPEDLSWLQHVADPGPRPEGTDEAEAIATELFGGPSQRRKRKTHVLTDDGRAHKFADAHNKRAERSPQLDNPDDIERLRRLRLSTTMEPIDAAWMYGVSVDVVYSELKAGRIPHTRFGRRFKVFTAHVFAQLFPDWKLVMTGADEAT